jgi:hypothetical protein
VGQGCRDEKKERRREAERQGRRDAARQGSMDAIQRRATKRNRAVEGCQSADSQVMIAFMLRVCTSVTLKSSVPSSGAGVGDAQVFFQA